MSKKFAIVVDSSFGIDSEYAAKHGLFLLPNQIVLENKSWKNDGIEISRDELVGYLKNKKSLGTSMLNIGEAEQLFDQLSQDYDHIIWFGLPSSTSGAFQQMKLREEDFPKLWTFDWEDSHYGERDTVLKVKEKTDDGTWGLKEIEAYGKWKKKNKILYAIMDDIWFVKRGGRISNAKALIASMLKIKPIIEFDRKLEAISEKGRTFKKGIDIMVRKTKEKLKTKDGKDCTVALEGMDTKHEYIQYAIQKIKEALPLCSIAEYCEVALEMAIHTGIGSLIIYGQKNNYKKL